MAVDWQKIQGLQGQIVMTPARHKPLRVARVSDSEIWLEENRKGNWVRQPTPVRRDEIDLHWDDLLTRGHLCKRYFEDRGMTFARGGNAQRARPRAIFALLSCAYPEQVQSYTGGDQCNARLSGIRIKRHV